MSVVIVKVLKNTSVRRRDEKWQLLAGDWLVLTPQSAQRLLKAAPGRMQILPDRDSTPESSSEGCPPVYWQRPSGGIVGPGTVEQLTTDTHRIVWLVVSYHGESAWIRASTLRTRQEFEEQQHEQETSS